MDEMDALEELQAMSRRHSNRSAEELLLLHQRKFQSAVLQKQEEEDEETVRSIFGDKLQPVLRRLDDEDDDEKTQASSEQKTHQQSDLKTVIGTTIAKDALPVVAVRKRKTPQIPMKTTTPAKKSLIVSYSDSDSDS
jgi:hypothetical protein